MIALVRDITERKRAGAELERLRHRDELLLHAVGEGICGLDAQSGAQSSAQAEE